MKVIGITGGSGAGKTAICNLLKEQGASIIDADKIARKIVEIGQPALQDIENAFGKEILLDSGHLNRKKLGSIVFTDKERLKLLNEITHPRIIAEIERSLDEMQQRQKTLVVVDAPLLFETALNQLVGEIWVVVAPLEMRIQRIMERDKLSREEAKLRISSQKDPKDYLLLADVVIENDGDLQKIEKQIVQYLQS